MAKKSPKETPLAKAIRKAGGAKKLASGLGITAEAIYQWPECPIKRVLEVERISGVPRHELRPDFFDEARHSR